MAGKAQKAEGKGRVKNRGEGRRGVGCLAGSNRALSVSANRVIGDGPRP